MRQARSVPRWAELILRLTAPAADVDALLDELTDELARELARDGERAARTWLVREVLRSIPPIFMRRVILAMRNPSRRVTMSSRAEMLRSDLSYALRQLRRAPGFTLTVLFAFALGIGANATMFGIVDELLLRPPAHVRSPNEIVALVAGTTQDGFGQRTLNFPVFAAIRGHSAGFSEVAAAAAVSVPFGRGDHAANLDGLLVSASYFPLLGVTPQAGRFFREDEDIAPVGAPVAVISHDFWQRQFSGSDNALGATLLLGDRQFTVIGIAPRNFTGVEYAAPDVWLPISSGGAMQFLGKQWTTQSIVTWLRVYARSRPSVPIAEAARDAMRLAREAAPNAFFTQDGWSFEARPVMAARSEEHGASTTIAILLGAMSLIVLLIACANVANLLLARGIRRRREIAVRLALGVTRRRLVEQFLTESLLLAALSGGAAIIVAILGGLFARRFLLADLALSGGVVEPRVVTFTIIVALMVGGFTGLIPALQASRTRMFSTIGTSGERAAVRRTRSQSALLAVQAALSFVLLLGAGLFGRSLSAIDTLHMGVDIEHVLVGSMSLRSIGRPASEADAVFTRAFEQVAAVPGVASAAISASVPFGPTYGTNVGVMASDSVHHYSAVYNIVTPNYFRTLGTSLLAGRDFSAADGQDAPRVVIIDQKLALRAWGHQNPIGRCLRIRADSLPCATVVGVVENVRRQSIFEDSTRFVYLPLAQARSWISERYLVARAAGNPATIAETVRRAMQTAAPELPFADVHLLKDQPIVQHERLPFKLGAALLGVFGLLALLLAAVGVYGVISYDVGQRTREIGVRMAFGAQAADVAALVVRDGLRMVVLGGVVGVVVALVGGRMVQPLLYGTSPHDPVVLVGVTSLLLTVAAMACLVPVRRAMRVDINAAIRQE
ncbi:MAG TPA: ADOP family duplicated permease [Gemmatimonadaceae bacterium]|nr:ADOP family duplicated permease [Gemmatimonadaceae bacterium]